MRFKIGVVAGFVVLIFLTLLLLSSQSFVNNIFFHVLFALIICAILSLLLITDELSRTHLFVTVVLFLSLAGLILQLMGKPTLTTFFLGGMFILTYMFTIAIVLLAKAPQESMFDRMLSAKERKAHYAKLRKQQLFVPVEKIIDEPPRITVGKDGVAKVAKTRKKRATKKKSTRKKSAKRR